MDVSLRLTSTPFNGIVKAETWVRPELLRPGKADNTQQVETGRTNAVTLYGNWGAEPSLMEMNAFDGSLTVPGDAAEFGPGDAITPTLAAKYLETMLEAADIKGTSKATVGSYYPLSDDGRIVLVHMKGSDFSWSGIHAAWLMATTTNAAVSIATSPRIAKTTNTESAFLIRQSDGTGWFVGPSDGSQDPPIHGVTRVEWYTAARLQALGAVPKGADLKMSTPLPLDAPDGSMVWKVSWTAPSGRMSKGVATVRVLLATEGIFRMDITGLVRR